MTSNNKISTLSNHQLPSFIRADHPDLAVFLEKYYQFLEQSETTLKYGKPVERAINFLASIDVDESEHDDILEELYKKFIQDLPKTIVADKQLVMKYIKDFYRAKGSEKATIFLVNILTGDSNTEIYYPKTDILKASDGKWTKRQSLRINDIKVNDVSNTMLTGLTTFQGNRIVGQSSNASAIVENTNRFFEGSTRISEIFLSQISGTFESGEQILANYINEGENNTIQANIFSKYISSVVINEPGTEYSVGENLNVIDPDGSGSGASIQITDVSEGSIQSVSVLDGAAGFQANDLIIFSGTGTGANAYVSSVQDDGLIHANSYTLYTGGPGLEANTLLSNTVFTNLNSTNANSTIIEALTAWEYGNTGPATIITVLNSGSGYGSDTTANIVGNTVVRSLGILGKMTINDGGSDYEIGDDLNFYNVPGGMGSFAYGQVANVDANGTITSVEFESIDSMPPGGIGFDREYLPTVDIVSANGTGANVTVDTILGKGDILSAANSIFGAIEKVSIVSGGSNYSDNTFIDTANAGGGTANVSPVIIAGVFTGPGRFLNDDGFLSSHNFLRGYHYYQNYSYVIRSFTPLKQIKKTLLTLGNPAGLKLFATLKVEYENNTQLTTGLSHTETGISLFSQDTYDANTAFAFRSTWNTTNTSAGSSGNNQITLPLLDTGEYYFNIDWGDGNSDLITEYDQSEVTHTYTVTGEYPLTMTGIIKGWDFANSGDKLKILTIPEWGPLTIGKNTATQAGAGFGIDCFYGCTNLTISATDTPTINGDFLRNLFRDCTALTQVPNYKDWDLAGVSIIGNFLNSGLEQIDVTGSNMAPVTLQNFLRNLGVMTAVTGLGGIDITQLDGVNNVFADGTTFPTSDYDTILIGWESQDVNDNVEINFGNSTYTSGGAAANARSRLINDHNWSISDNGSV